MMTRKGLGSALLAAATLAAAATGTARAGVVDTFTRSDGSPVTDSVGQTEVGGFDYVERGNSPTATVANGTAEIAGGELQVYGRLGTMNNDTGGVYLPGYNAPDVTLSLDVRFVHSIAAPDNTQELANSLFIALRSQSSLNFAATSPSDDGLLAIEFISNGGVLVRENRNGTLTTLRSRNFADTAGRSNVRTAGELPASFNGLPFDVDQDGFLDDAETFRFGAEVSGTQLKLFLNGAQFGPTMTLAETAGLNGNGIGLHKNRIAFAFETASDLYLDNFDLVPIPEPASLGMVMASGSLLAGRRRRRRT
jgi:hypothetical protein